MAPVAAARLLAEPAPPIPKLMAEDAVPRHRRAHRLPPVKSQATSPEVPQAELRREPCCLKQSLVKASVLYGAPRRIRIVPSSRRTPFPLELVGEPDGSDDERAVVLDVPESHLACGTHAALGSNTLFEDTDDEVYAGSWSDEEIVANKLVKGVILCCHGQWSGASLSSDRSSLSSAGTCWDASSLALTFPPGIPLEGGGEIDAPGGDDVPASAHEVELSSPPVPQPLPPQGGLCPSPFPPSGLPPPRRGMPTLDDLLCGPPQRQVVRRAPPLAVGMKVSPRTKLTRLFAREPLAPMTAR